VGERKTDKQTNKESDRGDIMTETEVSSSHLFAVPILVLWVGLKKNRKREKKNRKVYN
jgi:hypothetical protein